MTRRLINQEKSIIVSIGGGRVGCELLECAIAASALIKERLPHMMLIFTGPYLPEEQFIRLKKSAAGSSQITIERFTASFLSRLEQADLSISMAGYNTCMNILTTGVRALVYPFTGADNEEQEQTIRANKLEELGVVSVIRDHELEPQLLAERIMRCCGPQNRALCPSLDLRGAETTAAIITELLGESAVGAGGNGQ
jgi:predicted glycosyltransferase